MIKVDKIVSLDDKEVKVNDLITFQDGVLKNGKNMLTFDIDSGLEMERVDSDTVMILLPADLEKDKEYTLNQEPNQNPFVKLELSILMQPSDDLIESSDVRFTINYDEDFQELIPSNIKQSPYGAEVQYDTLDINTNIIIFKMLTEIDNIANIRLELFSY